MKTKQRLHINLTHGWKTACAAFLLLLAGCSGQDMPTVDKEDEPQVSDKEIALDIEGWKPLDESRATIYEDEGDFKSEASGGGNFTLYAYMKESAQTFIGGARVNYQASSGRWRFYSHPNYIEYYWPQSGTVDFFAYMPWKDSGKNKNITVGSYSKNTGLSISCQMQSEITNLEDPTGQETIIAYTTGKSKTNGSVNMHFVHPFAAVYFKLHQAHRDLTINWIQFNNVYLTGTTTLNTTTEKTTKIQWTIPSVNTTGTFIININKTIPTDINFNGEVGGPYLVMPQIFGKGTDDDLTDDVTITINYTWDDKQDSNTTNDTKEFTRSITTSNITSWIAGNKYTYILDLGDNKEEILFKVMVEPWTSHDYENIVDVE